MTERIGIIGGGIVGIAIARALAQHELQVTVIEKEHRVAMHQTGHNSGVVHAGVYYSPGSLKAALCSTGRKLIKEYCQEKKLPYREVGKLVVAVTSKEIPGLNIIESHSRLNGVPGLRRVDSAQMKEIEPSVAGVAAIHSPHTAVVDYASIAEAMAEDVRECGGTVLLGHEVTEAIQQAGKVTVITTAVELEFDRLIVCAGLQSDIVARMLGADPSPKILPFRGEYWSLAKEKRHLITGMVYPVPDPRFPFLGVHFTRGVYDDVQIGPNAVPAMSREGYSWGKISLRDTWESLMWPGAPVLARQHWRMGVNEIAASLVKPLYYKKAQRYIPELKMTDLTSKTASGVRAQAWGRDGALLDDFAIDQLGPVTILRNVPSPAATSAIAIANYVLDDHLLTSHHE